MSDNSVHKTTLKSLTKYIRVLPLLRGKHSDVAWNFVSFVLFGLSVTGTSLLFSRYYSPQHFGYFNLGFTLWMIGAQFLGAGVQFSVLTKVAQDADSPTKQHQQLLAGLMAVICWNMTAGVLLLGICTLLPSSADSSFIIRLILLVLPAAIALSINKVMLAYCNSGGELKAYAVFSAFRGFILFIIGLLFIAFDSPGNLLPLSLSIAETTTFLLLITYLLIQKKVRLSFPPKTLIQEHFSFGLRAMPGALVIDLNTRVDVIMLSILSSSVAVGIYSFAAVFIDGMGQLGIVARTLTNPRITEAYARKDFVQLNQIFSTIRRVTYLGMGAIGIGLGIFYPILLSYGGFEEYSSSLPTFFILLGSLLITSGYLPFLMILNQTGKPLLQTLLYMAICMVNIFGNMIFIPHFHELGAAIGTALAFFASAIAIHQIMQRSTPPLDRQSPR